MDDKRIFHGSLLQVNTSLVAGLKIRQKFNFSEKFFSKRDLVVEEMEETTAKLDKVTAFA